MADKIISQFDDFAAPETGDRIIVNRSTTTTDSSGVESTTVATGKATIPNWLDEAEADALYIPLSGDVADKIASIETGAEVNDLNGQASVTTTGYLSTQGTDTILDKGFTSGAAVGSITVVDDPDDGLPTTKIETTSNENIENVPSQTTIDNLYAFGGELKYVTKRVEGKAAGFMIIRLQTTDGQRMGVTYTHQPESAPAYKIVGSTTANRQDRVPGDEFNKYVEATIIFKGGNSFDLDMYVNGVKIISDFTPGVDFFSSSSNFRFRTAGNTSGGGLLYIREFRISANDADPLGHTIPSTEYNNDYEFSIPDVYTVHRLTIPNEAYSTGKRIRIINNSKVIASVRRASNEIIFDDTLPELSIPPKAELILMAVGDGKQWDSSTRALETNVLQQNLNVVNSGNAFRSLWTYSSNPPSISDLSGVTYSAQGFGFENIPSGWHQEVENANPAEPITGNDVLYQAIVLVSVSKTSALYTLNNWEIKAVDGFSVQFSSDPTFTTTSSTASADSTHQRFRNASGQWGAWREINPAPDSWITAIEDAFSIMVEGGIRTLTVTPPIDMSTVENIEVTSTLTLASGFIQVSGSAVIANNIILQPTSAPPDSFSTTHQNSIFRLVMHANSIDQRFDFMKVPSVNPADGTINDLETVVLYVTFRGENNILSEIVFHNNKAALQQNAVTIRVK